MEQLLNKVAEIIRKNRKKKAVHAFVMSAACLVVFVTAYSLILPAITISLDQANDEPGLEVASSQGELLSEEYQSGGNEPETSGNVDQRTLNQDIWGHEGDVFSVFGGESSDADEVTFSAFGDDQPIGQFSYVYEDAQTRWEVSAELLEGAALPAGTQMTARILPDDSDVPEEIDTYTNIEKKFGETLTESGFGNITDPAFFALAFEKDGEEIVTEETTVPVRVTFRFYEPAPEGGTTIAAGEYSKKEDKAELRQAILMPEADGYSIIADMENAASVLCFAHAANPEKTTEEAEASGTESVVDSENETEIGYGTETGSETEIESETETVSEMEEAAETITEAETESQLFELSFEGSDYTVRLTYGAAAEIPADAFLDVREIEKGTEEYEMYLAASGIALGNEDTENTQTHQLTARFFDITIMNGEEKVEPKGTVSVDISYHDALLVAENSEINAVHFEEGADSATVLEATPQGEDGEVSSVSFDTDSFSVFGIVGIVIEKNVLASDGKNYKVTVTYGAETGIPTDADLAVEEIFPSENGDAGISSVYDEYVSKTENALGMEEGSAGYIRLFDIKIVDQDDHSVKYQPKEGTTVDVRIELTDAEDGNTLNVVHFADDQAEGDVVDASTESGADGSAVEFEAESFSVYSIVEGKEPFVQGDVTTVQSLSELFECYGDPDGFYLYTVGVKKYIMNSVKDNSVYPETSNILEAGKWYFENAGGDNSYYIYTFDSSGSRKYMKNIATNNGLNMNLSDSPETSFTVSEVNNEAGVFRFYVTDTNKLLQHSNGGNGMRLHTDVNNNGKITITYASSVGIPDDYYELGGKTFGIAYHNDSAAAAAVTAENKVVANQNRLAGLDMLMRSDVLGSDGILLVAQDSDIQEWTFESVNEDKYYITTTVDGSKKYLTIDGSNVTLEDTPHDVNSLIKATPGTGANSGKWHFSVNGYSLNFAGSSANGFNAANNSNSSTWLNLVEKSSLTEEDFVSYSARKISASDEILSAAEKDENGEIREDEEGNVVYKTEKEKVIIYTRVWNDTAKKYEFYAIDHDGSLLRVYDSGDLINWVGNQVNSALWEFTEYTNADGTPNYFYELQNSAYPNTYLVPQSGGIISSQPVGVNMEGRKNGFDYTTILSWDDEAYGYSGLKVVTDENGAKRVVTCPKDEADDFYFAVITPQVQEADPLTTVQTVDNTEYGINIRMIDFNNAQSAKKDRDLVQDAFFGSHAYNQTVQDSGLLSSNLVNGYPLTTASTGQAGRSLSELFNDMTRANHLFIQSVYNESGYFEYDSTQNFAHLNDDGNFTVYHQLGGIGTDMGVTRTHGQFMPYNEISQDVGYAYTQNGELITNRTDVLRNELSDTDPRKGEPLYSIPQNEADYFFGMELSASFTQTPDGLDNWGHDIIFEFTGDDDFWLYVDDELVLDLGGIHSAMQGTVNFRTGEVLNNTTRTTLYDLFKQNYAARGLDVSAVDDLFEVKQVDGKTVHVFKDYSTHTMKMFYMERGAGASNLKMRFNLASVKPGTAELSKKLTGTQSPSNRLMQYPYQIWYATAQYDKYEDGSYKFDANGNKVVLAYDDPVLMRQADSTANPIRVVYKGTNALVPFRESLTIDGIEYRNVFLLRPGETAVIMFPEDTYQYKTIECGVDSEVYEKVLVNGEDISDTGRLYHNTDGEQSGSGDDSDSRRKDYGTGYETADTRPRVEYTNQVAAGVMRTLTFKKAVYDVDGTILSDEEAAKVDATFSFRLYLGNEYANEDSLPLADMYTYYIRDPQGYYGMWDSQAQTFTRLEGVTTFEQFMALPEDVRRSATYTTSMYGAISKIRAGYTVEVRDLIVGTKYKVEERDEELPKGYTRRASDGYVRTDPGPEGTEYVYYTENGVYGRHVLTKESTITAEPVSDTIASKTDSPELEIRNQEGWGLTASKVWTDKDFMTHDPIYLAIYLRTGEEPDCTYTLLPDMVRQLTNKDTEAYFFFQDLKVNGTAYQFDQFVVREVGVTAGEGQTPAVDSAGKVTVDSNVTVTPIDDGDSIEVGGTPAGGTYRKETYTVSYETGSSTGRNSNIRNDIVTNARPGIRIFKTDWSGENYLSGAAFTLKDESGNNVAAASYTSDSTGLVTTAYLSPGTYKVEEIKTPSGYVAMDGEITITVAKDGDNKDTFTVTGDDDYFTFSEASGTAMPRITIRNRTVQELKIVKKGVDGETRTPLGGVHFALYDQVRDAEGNLREAYQPRSGYEDLVTNEEGLIENITMLDPGPGTYYLKEIAAPSGYKKLAEDLCFTIGEDGTVTIHNDGYGGWLTEDTSTPGSVSYQIEVENTPLGITIRKTDENGNPLQGAQFVLTRKNDNNIFVNVSDYGLGQNGLIDLTTGTEKTFTGMATGIYKLSETKAPDGYIITRKDLCFSVSDGTVKLTDENGNETTYEGVSLADNNTTIVVKNNIGVSLPATGGAGTGLIYLPGILLTAFAGAELMMRRRRKAA